MTQSVSNVDELEDEEIHIGIGILEVMQDDVTLSEEERAAASILTDALYDELKQ